MDSMPESYDFIMDRGRSTKAVMLELFDPPHDWSWDGILPDDFNQQIKGVETQVEQLVSAEFDTTLAAAQWDHALDVLLEDVALGIRLARVKFKDEPVKLRLFDGLRSSGQSRPTRYEQALDFEASWEKTDAAWVFKPTLTLASFRRAARRSRTSKTPTWPLTKTNSTSARCCTTWWTRSTR